MTVALAALAISAHGVPVTSAHAHGKAAGPQTDHHTRAHERLAYSPAHPREKTATLHRTTKTTRRPAGQPAGGPRAQAAAHKPTPEEVGRAAGLKIRAELDRRAAMRLGHAGRRPELVRTRYTPVHIPAQAARPAEADFNERPSSQPESEPMNGTTHYEAVDAQHETSPSADTDPGRTDPASASEASASESEATAPEPAGRNAVQPSFARHAAVRAPQAATILDDRAATTAGENTSDYNISEDTRLKAETEEASLSIARGYMPAPLRGNRASLERQNERLEAEGLERIEDEDDLASRISHHLLVPVPASSALIVNGNLPATHRYCRPWTARFLADLAAAHEAEFHRPLQVSSAVRTVEYQKKLMQVNGNAAPAEGDVVSPHLTGAAVDIAKDNLSRAEMAWMRRHLLAIEAEGKIDVEEEFQQSCFHIAVYKSYLPAYHAAPRHSQTPAQAHTGGAKGRTLHAPVAEGVSTQGL